MLWVNLIMDILGAIALGTEKYQKGGKFTRLARSNPRVLVMEHNWRQVIVHALFQIIVMLFLMFLGQFIFFNGKTITLDANGLEEETDGLGPFNLINPSPQGGVNRDTDRKRLDTICFHVFILMNIFNMINCRVLDTADHTEKNVFKTLCKFKMGCPPLPEHSIFWVILAGEIFLQHIIINTGVGETLFNCAELTTTEQVICWVIGSLSLPVNLIVKSIQVDKFAFV
jgi:magnesium-transporting ATPase (P-type)